MNTNTGKTGTINIPAPLHSTGGDGDGQVGNVVAYTGDIYDSTLGKNQADINTDLDTNAVHKTGDEEISDIKNFTDGIISGKGNSIASTDSKQLHIFGNDNTIEGSGQYAYNEATIMGYSNYLTGNGIQANTSSFTVGNYNIGDGSVDYGGSENITLGQYNNSSGYNNVMIGGDYGGLRLTGDANTTTYEIYNTTNYPVEGYYYLIGAKLFTSYPTDIIATVQSVQKASDNSNISITLDKTLNETTALSKQRVYFRDSTISGEYNVSIGANTVSGRRNYVYGDYNYTGSGSSDNSLIGTLNSTTSSYNYILGYYNTSGTYTKNSKNYSGDNAILGEYNTANGNNNCLIGYSNTAQSWGNYVLGMDNTLDYSNNAVVGFDNKCTSYYNFILGDDNNTTSRGVYILGDGCTSAFEATCFLGEGLTSATNSETLIGKYNLANAGNLITIGNGTSSAKSNYAEVKTDGSTYIKGIGNYDGTNRDSATSLQDVLDSKVGTDLNIKNGTGDNSLLAAGTNVETSVANSLAGGVNMNITGARAFGWGTGYPYIYLTGSDKTYTVNYNSTSSSVRQYLVNALKTAIVNAYVYDTSFNKVAQVVSAAANDANTITITLDTDLGTLTNGKYCLGNTLADRSLGYGVLNSSGKYSFLAGTYLINTANYANLLGYANGNTGANSNLIGNQNSNTGSQVNIIGSNNKNIVSATSILGANNNVNYTVSGTTLYPSYVVGINNTLNNRGYVLGLENTVNGEGSVVVGGGLTTNNKNETALGIKNKSTSSTTSSEASHFTIGNGDSDTEINSLEIKNNNDLYVNGIGGYDGTNSESASTVQDIVNNKVDNTETITMTATLSDGTTKTYTIYGKENA